MRWIWRGGAGPPETGDSRLVIQLNPNLREHQVFMRCVKAA
jgi:hypothetical protein